MARRMRVIVRVEGLKRPAVRAAAVRRWAQRMLAAMRLPDAELGVLLCDDATIHTLNRQWRRQDRPTDVLAFAMKEGPYAEHAREVLGDVVISLDTAARQAKERGRPLRDETITLLAHGLLHLCGWDHGTAAEERRMNAATDALRAAATVQDPRRTSTVDKVRRLPRSNRWQPDLPPENGSRKRRGRT